MNSFINQLESTNKRSGGELVGRVIIDTFTKRILFVPEQENHVPFLEKTFKKNEGSLLTVPNIFLYVGASIRVENNSIAEILVGISGLETFYREETGKALHTKEQVLQAKTILIDTLLKEHVPLKDTLKIEVVFV